MHAEGGEEEEGGGEGEDAEGSWVGGSFGMGWWSGLCV